MSAKRILFVDDEAPVLEGLRDLFRKQRREWDMTFASSGQAALLALGRAPFDVIVSDMRMPGMDGGVLLQLVKEKFPAVARIMLSGQADQASILRALPVVQQFLNKPCDADALHCVIERTCAMQALLHDQAIRRVIGRIESLPAAPRTYLELTQAAGREDVGPPDLAAIVERDPAIAVKVLQLANSAYFGLARQVTSIQQAVMYLGADLLKGLVLSAQVFGRSRSTPVSAFSLDRLQDHSIQTARLAKRLVGDPTRADEAFSAGVVHDIGKVVLACGLPQAFGEVLRLAGSSEQPFHHVEKQVLGVTHAEVGAYLLGVWGLPFQIVEAVAYHHTPRAVGVGERHLLTALHVADALVRRADNSLDGEFLEAAGVAHKLSGWRELAEGMIPAADAA